MSKGPDAFRTISEVAEELELPQHVLRFWETRFAQIKPLKRGGGRRYYRPDDVDLLRGIRYLLYGEGYTIRGVQRILKEQGARFVIGAARGEVAGLPSAQAADEEYEEGDALSAAPNLAMNGDEGDHLEPTFDPREFRTADTAEQTNGKSSGVASAARRLMGRFLPDESGGGREGLSGDELHRLQATISDLLEMKRLLDQAR